MRRLLVLPIFWASFLLPLVGQVRIHIKTVPANTPIGDTLFLAASFNDWNPGDRDYPFVRLPDGTYFIQLNIDSVFDYKITRGAWSSVEGGVVGEAIENRRFDPGLGHEAPQVVVQTWEDLPGRPPWANQVIRVRSIPTNTPADASIYIVGNFNRWHPADPRYELELQTDGTYQVSVPVWMDTLEYKFTRGSWKTVEGRKSGRARFNRQLIVHVPVPQPEVVVIESWEDLSGHPINIYTFLLLLAAFQGLLLIVAINTLQDYNRDANRLLSFLILLISLVLIGRVSTYDRDIFQLYPKLLLVPDLLYFLYAPVFYLYIRRLLLPEARNWNWSMLLHFLPFMLQLLVYLPLLGMEPGHFISLNTDLSLRWVFVLSGGIAFIYNLLYWWGCWRIIRNYQRQSDDEFSYGNNLQFLQTIMGLKAACLIIWAASYLIGGFGWLFAVETSRITDRSVDFLWVVFSLTVFILGYFAMRQPEIFKMPPLPPDIEPSKAEGTEAVPAISTELRTRVLALMEEQEVFLNPKLSLADLAAQVDTNSHTLSHLINEGLGMNFNDFVNSYRVAAFKERVQQDAYRHHTLLAIALMVGFNSKTAFNRSFKKLTGQTPRQFLQANDGQE